MSRRQRIGLLTFFGGLVLLNYPIIDVVNQPDLVFGIPQVFLYICGLWLAAIIVACLVSLDRQGSD